MTKAEFVKSVATDTDCSEKVVNKVLSGILDKISSILEAQDSVTFVGFGTFTVADRAAREGRNPATGEVLHIPAQKVPKFKPSKNLKEKVNG